MKGIVLVVQLGFSFMAFLFLAAVNWYQGSELVSDQFDWNYTATFSKLLNGIDTITSPKQISQLDFFIYSAKHYPVISIVMICSFLSVLLSLFLTDSQLPHGSIKNMSFPHAPLKYHIRSTVMILPLFFLSSPVHLKDMARRSSLRILDF